MLVVMVEILIIPTEKSPYTGWNDDASRVIPSGDVSGYVSHDHVYDSYGHEIAGPRSYQ